MDVVSIRHCTYIYMEGPGKIINKFNSANFRSDIWSLDLLNTVQEYGN